MEAEEVAGHVVRFDKHKEEGPNAYRARVSGPKASESCPGRGVKTIYADTEGEVRDKVDAWLGNDLAPATLDG